MRCIAMAASGGCKFALKRPPPPPRPAQHQSVKLFIRVKARFVASQETPQTVDGEYTLTTSVSVEEADGVKFTGQDAITSTHSVVLAHVADCNPFVAPAPAAASVATVDAPVVADATVATADAPVESVPVESSSAPAETPL
jgi:hypothetical protein